MSEIKLPKPLPGAKSQKAPTTEPPDKIFAPADPAKADPEGAPPISHSVPLTERICGYPQCNKVMPTDQPCPLHEQICAQCGVINIRGTQVCIKCGGYLPPLPIVLEVSAPAAPSSQELVSGSITLPPTTPAGLSSAEEIVYGAAEKAEADAKAEAEAKIKAEAKVAKAKIEADTKAAKAKIEAEAKVAKAKIEAEADAKAKIESEAKVAKAKIEAEIKAKAEAEARIAKAKIEADAMDYVFQIKSEAEAKVKAAKARNKKTIALALILVLLIGVGIGYLLNKQKPVIVEKPRIVKITEKVPCPPTKTVEKTAEVKAPPMVPDQTKVVENIVEVKTQPTTPPPMTPPVTTPMRPAPEKEITFRAEEIGHVWTGPTDQFLDKDDD